MSKPTKSSIEVRGTTVSILSVRQQDYLCLTDIARFKDSERTDYIIQNWLRNRNTIEFLGVWEQLNNPDFNPIENAFAKLKALLRKAAERTVEGLWSAIGQLIDLITPKEIQNLFDAAGYDAA